jgi:HD-like signal output (HDOD) protein
MSQELTAEQIQQALQGITIPPQPQIMVDLQFEQYMPDPDLETIAKLISQDPGLPAPCSSWSIRRITA